MEGWEELAVLLCLKNRRCFVLFLFESYQTTLPYKQAFQFFTLFPFQKHPCSTLGEACT